MLRRWETGTQTRGSTRARSRSPSKTSGAHRPVLKSQTHTSDQQHASLSAFRRGSDTTSSSSPYSPKNARAVKSAGVGSLKKANKEPPKMGDAAAAGGLLSLEELRGVLSGGGDDVSVTSQNGRRGSPLRVRCVRTSPLS